VTARTLLAPLAGLALAASGAAAQDTGDRARLDDFAIPRSDSAVEIKQLDPGAAAVIPATSVPDRTVSSAAPAKRSVESDQLAQGAPSPRQAQVSNPAASRGAIPSAGSSTADSRPRGVIRIAGSDRCDPQLAGRELEQCQRILELRAQEFHATAAPQLSAEEALLAEQRGEEERGGDRSAAQRVRLASMDDPDAALESNQELAALYLGNAPSAPQKPPEEQPTDEQATLADVIGALIGQQVTITPGP
jgi:hypothetical protein